MLFYNIEGNDNRTNLLRERFYTNVPFMCGNSLECDGTYTTSERRWDIKCSGGKQEITCRDNENKTSYRRLNFNSSLVEVNCIGQTQLVLYLSKNQLKA